MLSFREIPAMGRLLNLSLNSRGNVQNLTNLDYEVRCYFNLTKLTSNNNVALIIIGVSFVKPWSYQTHGSQSVEAYPCDDYEWPRNTSFRQNLERSPGQIHYP